MSCSIPSCPRVVYARGWCDTHYRRWRKHGDPFAYVPRGHRLAPPEERFRRYVTEGQPPEVDPTLGPCLLWTASVANSGYGTISAHGRNERAHRFAWTMAHGPIPPGMVLDHLCCVRRCVRLSHLELVTPSENSRRGGLKRRRNGRPVDPVGQERTLTPERRPEGRA